MDTNPEPTKKTDAPCIFQCKDYWMIVGLVAMGYQILNIECKEDPRGQKYLVWSFPAEAYQVERQYNRGEVMPIDLHKIADAANLFKRNMQYYQIR